ncbi:MAG: photosystem II complex extrinsic protein PsbU [Prochloraceae cyanobacterium]|nr:photosystem II complex extrinsic protein PsbU [Prochloraceae cyanobacterium]
MRRAVGLLAVLVLFLSCFGFVGSAAAINLSEIGVQSTLLAAADRVNPADAKLDSEFGQKVDLNNSHVRKFRKFPGFYPNLASKIVKNAPYEKVEDVLEIPGLSDRQKELLQANLENFTVTETADVFTEGGDRFNPGVY